MDVNNISQGEPAEAVNNVYPSTGQQTTTSSEDGPTEETESAQPLFDIRGLTMFQQFVIICIVVLFGLYLSLAQRNPPPSGPDIVRAQTDSPEIVREKERAFAAVKYVRMIIDCQRAYDHKYPKSLFDIENKCIPTNSNITLPSIVKDLYTINYMYTNEGRGYYFEIPAYLGHGYIVTKSKVEFTDKPDQNDTEKLNYARDLTRVSILDSLKSSILAVEAKQPGNKAVLCGGLRFPCFGDSRTPRAAETGGTGWIKINLQGSLSKHFSTLPVDNTNNELYHYVYCADSTGWEINAALESGKYNSYAEEDGGDDKLKYEVGSNLRLIDVIPGCKY